MSVGKYIDTSSGPRSVSWGRECSVLQGLEWLRGKNKDLLRRKNYRKKENLVFMII